MDMLKPDDVLELAYYDRKDSEIKLIVEHENWSFLRGDCCPEIHKQLHKFPIRIRRLLKGIERDTDDVVILNGEGGEYGHRAEYIRMLPFVEGKCEEFDLPENPKAGFIFPYNTKTLPLVGHGDSIRGVMTAVVVI
jgi:hypothetical protein